jgi:hypothetical protein
MAKALPAGRVESRAEGAGEAAERWVVELFWTRRRHRCALFRLMTCGCQRKQEGLAGATPPPLFGHSNFPKGLGQQTTHSSWSIRRMDASCKK